MHDLRALRDDPAGFDAALARRGLPPQSARLLELDRTHREALTAAERAVAARNQIAREIGRAIAAGETERAAALRAEVAALKDAPAAGHPERTALEAALAELPNLPAVDTPDGAGEADNLVVGEHGARPSFAFAPREHWDFGSRLGFDVEDAGAVAGARFAYLRGPFARLHRALGQFMLDAAVTDGGYEEVAPPLLVRDAALYGTGQLPRFADDLFRTTDDRWLIPTAEVSLTNLVRDRIVEAAALPLRFAALTPCFRSEAGAAGRDTRGLVRQHQFDKVELVSVTVPEASEAEHERMTAAAEAVLDRLGLAWRRVLLCAGDLGFQSRKTYDLEVWMAGQARYREISSCSNCGDFQARRMNARMRSPDGRGTRFVHTLNGSALAVGRALVAVVEHYQTEGGGVVVPDVLRPYLGGIERFDP